MSKSENRLKTAIVTGAGSGVGAAVALALGREGWRVALVGRNRDSLDAVAAQMTGAVVHPCDIGNADAVSAMGAEILAAFGGVEVVVNSAGTNVPRRAFDVLSTEDYLAMIATNLNGAFYCTQAFLPQMRARGSGTIVNIVSEAGKAASPKSGPGYVVSKFGMAGLTQSINAEERARGIRACAIFPGDIDTALLDKRPNPPDAAARSTMMQPEDIAACALLAINLPSRVVIEEMLVRPR